jgi:hypothetical protein
LAIKLAGPAGTGVQWIHVCCTRGSENIKISCAGVADFISHQSTKNIAPHLGNH